MATIVLVPLDDSDKDPRALQAAAAVAELSGGSIRLLRVLDTPVDNISARGERLGVVDAAKHAKSTLEDNVDRAAAQLAQQTGRRVTAEVIENTDVAQAILERARDDAVEVVVMATRAPAGVDKAVRGSVADRVMRASPRPVLLVPPSDSGLRESIPLDRILVPFDGSRGSTATVESLVQWERVGDLDYVLLEVIATAAIDEPGAEGVDPALVSQFAKAHEAADGRLRAVAKQMSDGGAKSVDVQVVHASDTAAAIVRFARDNDVDMIAMSTRGHAGLKRLVLGSVAAGVVREADLPVLLFPSPAE
jgi:nucleotide-binding universal stress UspA family protein